MYYLQIVNIVLLTFIAYQSSSDEQKTGIALFGAQIQGSLAASVHVSMVFLGPVTPGRPIQIPPLVQLHENYTASSSWPVFGPVVPISSLEHNAVTTILDVLPSNLCLSEAQPVARSYAAISPPPTIASEFRPPPSDSPTPTTKLATTNSFSNLTVILIIFTIGCFLVFCPRRVRPVLGIQVGRFIFFVGMVEATTEVAKVLARPRRRDVEKLGEDRDEDRAEVPANVPPPATPVADPITPPRRPPPATLSTSIPDTPMIDRVAALISSAAALARGQEEDKSESGGLN
ncbi:hypothetical protein DFH07DRAFT_968847 [Mycena maculata]|uniref:Uncharacterized protein n=1 Tax=Mycena maculata TaxID=230809 RepID=A0AAD7HZU4_9AGAR|nr:hypothetical protein DFH07DRAFT_968847 [Mycena maculata]